MNRRAILGDVICTIPVSRYARVGRIAVEYTRDHQAALVEELSTSRVEHHLLDGVRSGLRKSLSVAWGIGENAIVISQHPAHDGPKTFRLDRGAEVVSYPRLLVCGEEGRYRGFYGLSMTVCAPPEAGEHKHPKIWSRLTLERSSGETIVDRTSTAWAKFRAQSTELHQAIVDGIASNVYRSATDRVLGPDALAADTYEIVIHVSHVTDPDVRRLLREVNLGSIRSIGDVEQDPGFASIVQNFLRSAGYEPLPSEPFAFRPSDVQESEIRSRGWVRVQDAVTDALSYQVETTANRATIVGFSYAPKTIQDMTSTSNVDSLWKADSAYPANRVSQRLAAHFAVKYAQ